METPTQEPTQDLTPDTDEEITEREALLAIADELSGIRAALVSALQLICSVPPFKGSIGVNEDGELFALNREQRRAAK
jgi:hypothetical protein